MIAFQDHPVFGDDLGTVAVLDMQGNKKTLTETYGETQKLAWSPDGKEIWYNGTLGGANRGVFAVTLAGKVRTLLTAPGRIALEDVRPDGDVLLDNTSSRRVLMVFTPEFPEGRDFSWLDWPYLMRFSRDGKQILFGDQHVAGGQYGTFIRNLDGTPATSLGIGDAMDISDDGKFAISRLLSAPEQLMLLPTGAGEARQITHSQINHLTARWLPDGRFISVGSEPGHSERTFLVDLNGKETPITPEGFIARAVSPDGKQLLVMNSATFKWGHTPRSIRMRLARCRRFCRTTARSTSLLMARVFWFRASMRRTPWRFGGWNSAAGNPRCYTPSRRRKARFRAPECR